MTTGNLLTREEAANYLGVKPQTLNAWNTTKRYALKIVKIGSRAMYRKTDLDAFIEARTVDPTAPEGPMKRRRKP